MKFYKFYLLLGVLCALSSFFYAQAGYMCTSYAVEALVPASTLIVGGCLGDLVGISLLPTIFSGIAGCLLVKARIAFNTNNNIIISTKVLQAMIPLCWYWWQEENGSAGKENLKWCALVAMCMEIGIQVCF